jgi:hypothetical protein
LTPRERWSPRHFFKYFTGLVWFRNIINKIMHDGTYKCVQTLRFTSGMALRNTPPNKSRQHIQFITRVFICKRVT